MKNFKIHFYNILGWFSFVLGVIGVFLPILPTTPFIILASYFFSKGSPKFYHWLTNLKVFGQIIKDWNEYGTINKSAKLTATIILILVIFAYLYLANYAYWIKLLITVILCLVILFINTRPSKNKIPKIISPH
jgi:uncharacterized membrane protein YbaN (DUF454 family)